jgi:hypothetical protein
MSRNLAILTILWLGFACGLHAQEEDVVEERDSSAGLPKQYASKYLVSSGTVSPDQKMAVIYPKDDDGKSRDFLITLKPFKILTALETKFPYFAHESHGGLSAEWSKDSSVALVTLDSKWGAGDVLLYEIRNGKLTRSTNLLRKISALLEPDYQKVKPEPYNDLFHFVFDDDMASGAGGDSDQPVKECSLDENQRVKIHAAATTDPKHIGGIKAWDAKFEGVWDIPQSKFTSERVTRIFGGVRKGD